MILRKPYAFFIKHFKFIHFIIAILMGYVALKSVGVLSFFNEYLQSTATIIGEGVAIELFPIALYLVLILALIMLIIVLIVMKTKKKAILFYVVNTACLIYTFFILLYAHRAVLDLELGLIEIRKIKLIQDLLVISIVFISIGILITALRSLGFDIKKFEFGKELDLEVDEKDREEFELDVSIDTDSYRRKLRRGLRNLRYVYKENKTMLFLTILIIVGCISGYLYWNYGIYNKMNKEGSVVAASNVMFGVRDSYVTKTDYQGNTINQSSFIIVRIKVKNNSERKNKLETGRISLTLDKMTYYPTTEYLNKFDDLGTVYVTDELPKDTFKEYLLVYQVPTSLVNTRVRYLKYSVSTNNSVKFKINPVNIDEAKEEVTLTKDKQIEFDNVYLKGSKLVINNAVIDKRFKVNYRFCYTKDDCEIAYEYVRANLNTNYDKVLLKIEGNYEFNNKLNIFNANRIGNLLANYGTIKYTINGQEKTVALSEVLPTKITPTNAAYLEIPSEVENASKIDYILNLRNDKYVYHIK